MAAFEGCGVDMTKFISSSLSHVAVIVKSYADQLGSAGWLMHSKSLVTARELKTAYFVRPGTPYIVEAYENVAPVGPSSIERFSIFSNDVTTQARTDALGITNSGVRITNEQMNLTIEGREIKFSDLIL
jgi:hypothetical protein